MPCRITHLPAARGVAAGRPALAGWLAARLGQLVELARHGGAGRSAVAVVRPGRGRTGSGQSCAFCRDQLAHRVAGVVAMDPVAPGSRGASAHWRGCAAEPPMRSRASSTITLRPASRSCRAAARLTMPAPSTITACEGVGDGAERGGRGRRSGREKGVGAGPCHWGAASAPASAACPGHAGLGGQGIHAVSCCAPSSRLMARGLAEAAVTVWQMDAASWARVETKPGTGAAGRTESRRPPARSQDERPSPASPALTPKTNPEIAEIL